MPEHLYLDNLVLACMRMAAKLAFLHPASPPYHKVQSPLLPLLVALKIFVPRLVTGVGGEGREEFHRSSLA